jgi:mono/diheme cytochrome c family protein
MPFDSCHEEIPLKPALPALAALLFAGLLAACEQPAGETTPAMPALIQPGAENDPPTRQHDPAQVTRGRIVYDQYCADCHGAEGKGQAGDWRIRDADGYYPPPPLDDSAHAWHHPTAVLLDVIRNGSEPGEGKMPAWKNVLSETEMQDVVVYIKSLWSDPVYRLWWKLEKQSLED